jgi:hypothetical protein
MWPLEEVFPWVRTARKIGNGLIQWVGEAAVGLIPWLAYMLTHNFSMSIYVTALCSPRVLDSDFASFHANCVQLTDSPIPEICILAVVISGLSLLSIGQFAPGRPRPPRTALTYLMLILAIGSLLAGAIFYALITAHLEGVGLEKWSYLVLSVALISSLTLALQESFLSAVER